MSCVLLNSFFLKKVVAIGSRSFKRLHFILNGAGCMLHLLHLISSTDTIVSFVQVISTSLISILVIKSCFNFLAIYACWEDSFLTSKVSRPILIFSR